jgi:hypothetical protein
MSHPDNERDLDALVREALARPKREPAPEDFAAHVLERRRQDRAVVKTALSPGAAAALTRAARRGRVPGFVRALLVVGIAAAAFGFFIAGRGHRAPGVVGGGGGHHAKERKSIRLGARGVAVMEAGSALSEAGDQAGVQTWQQSAGEVFYRIDHGDPLRIATPLGDVLVLGTCFRVEVGNMKINPQGSKVGFIAGAALASTVVVTVYEGRVRLANGNGQTEIGAGERGSLPADARPKRLATEEVPSSQVGAARVPALRIADAPDLESLRQKLAVQDKELAELRKLRNAGKGPAEKYLDIPKDELLARAQRCEIRFDVPQVIEFEPGVVGKNSTGDWGEKAGLSDTERDAMNESLRDLHARLTRDLRKLYIELSGDERTAQQLPVGGLMAFIMQKSSNEERVQARDHLSKELAGLAAAPADLSRTSVAERALRLFSRAGDDLERSLGEKVGSERAHSLRRIKDGWPGGRNAMGGCEGDKGQH